jgi:hypothetical protein
VRAGGAEHLETMNFPQKTVASIFRPQAYLQFYREPLSKAIIYLALLTLVLSGISSIRNVYLYSQGLNEIIAEFAYSVPDFELDNGRLRVEGPMPLYVDQSEDFLFVIDTSGQLSAAVLDGHADGVFISAYELVDKTAYEISVIRFADLPAFRLTKSGVEQWLPLLRWVNLFIVLFGITFSFLGKLVSAFLVGLAGMIMVSVQKIQVGFDQLYKLSIYALTLPMLLKLLVGLTGQTVPGFNLLYYSIALVFLWRALTVLRTAMDTEEETHLTM